MKTWVFRAERSTQKMTIGVLAGCLVVLCSFVGVTALAGGAGGSFEVYPYGPIPKSVKYLEPVPRQFEVDQIYPFVINIDKLGQKVKCQTGFFQSIGRTFKGSVLLAAPSNLLKVLENFSLDPECLHDYQVRKAELGIYSLRGFSFGNTIAAGVVGIGGFQGREIVITKVDDQTAMIGAVDYLGAGVSASPSDVIPYPIPLPNYSSGIIHGECDEGVLSYLGEFGTVETGATLLSYGKGLTKAWEETMGASVVHAATHETAPDEDEIPWGKCNAVSQVIGPDSSAVGFTGSYFYPSSQYFFLVRGKRVQKLIDYIGAVNSGNRKYMTYLRKYRWRVRAPKKNMRAKDFRRKKDVWMAPIGA